MVITGASKGIGKYLAEYYLERGNVVIGCSRSASSIQHGDYHHYLIDVSNETDVHHMFSDIRKKFGLIYVLINNAGVASMNHSFLTPLTTVKKILDTNAIGTFLCSREAAKIMAKTRRGRIINFSSFAVPFRLEGEAIYAASKAAIETLTGVLSKEYSTYNITVNAVAPPAVQTDLTKGVSKDKMDALINRQSVKRYGTMEEIAKVIDFFIDNEMITGQIIYMGGI